MQPGLHCMQDEEQRQQIKHTIVLPFGRAELTNVVARFNKNCGAPTPTESQQKDT